MTKVLSIIPLEPIVRTMLDARFDCVHRPKGFETVADSASIDVVLTNGSIGLSAAQIAALPRLRLILCSGAGYENVDQAAASAAGIIVANSPGVNDSTVADHAIGLILAVIRDMPRRDAAVRRGEWGTIRRAAPTLSGSTVGIVGLGNIGRKIADRLAAFETKVLYATRTPRDVPYGYRANVLALAEESDIVVLACPGGPATRHLIDAVVLSALGSKGFLINVARGSVVDTAALSAALRSGTIAGAAIDVFEGEPHLPDALKDAPNLLVTPHMAGRSPASEQAQGDLIVRNIEACIAGSKIPNAIGPNL
jgi:lactate dehydrogenase-like 2-hydroxyacid dehydrogenase